MLIDLDISLIELREINIRIDLEISKCIQIYLELI